MEETNINQMLNDEIAAEIRALDYLEAGSKEKAMAIDSLVQLYKLRVDENKSIWDTDEKENRRVMEEETNAREDEIKRIQIAEQKKDRYFRVGIAGAELMIPLIFYGIWMKKGFKFEETGTITSSTFKGLINRFRPTKK